MQGFLDDAAGQFRDLADRHRTLTQQYLTRQLPHSVLRHQLIQREAPEAGEMTGHIMGKMIEQTTKAQLMRVPYNAQVEKLEEEVDRMRVGMTEILNRTEELWNFGQVVFKNRPVKGEDIKKLEAPESIRFEKCKSGSWKGIGKELEKQSTVSALEFDSCEDVGFLGGLTPAGDFICEAVRKIKQLRILAIGTSWVIQRTAK